MFLFVCAHTPPLGKKKCWPQWKKGKEKKVPFQKEEENEEEEEKEEEEEDKAKKKSVFDWRHKIKGTSVEPRGPGMHFFFVVLMTV